MASNSISMRLRDPDFIENAINDRVQSDDSLGELKEPIDWLSSAINQTLDHVFPRQIHRSQFFLSMLAHRTSPRAVGIKRVQRFGFCPEFWSTELSTVSLHV